MRFFTFRTLFAYFAKKNKLFTTTQKHYFSGPFLKLSFPFFSSFPLSFSNIKKDPKKCIFCVFRTREVWTVMSLEPARLKQSCYATADGTLSNTDTMLKQTPQDKHALSFTSMLILRQCVFPLARFFASVLVGGGFVASTSTIKCVIAGAHCCGLLAVTLSWGRSSLAALLPNSLYVYILNIYIYIYISIDTYIYIYKRDVGAPNSPPPARYRDCLLILTPHRLITSIARPKFLEYVF